MLHVLCAEGNILGLFMFFCFIFCFYFYFRWSYGIVMWEIATLGKIPTSTYFAACVTFSLQREGGGVGDRAVRFCPILLVLYTCSFALPNY